MHTHAQTAIRAAQLRPQIGHWATWRYIAKRGCPPRLYVLACILQCAQDGVVFRPNSA